METPSPDEIRVLRGARSRAEFGALIGVTALTVYRWELPPDSPELRRPRGKVLQRLQAWIASQQPSAGTEGAPTPVPAAQAVPSAPAPLALDASEHAALAPILHAIDECQFESAERNLVRLLAAGTLRGEASRALASIRLAWLQLLARHDTRNAFTSLLAVGADVSRLPRSVQLEYHLTSAVLYAHPDAQLFNPGRTNHHAALAEALLDAGTGDHRFLLWFARFISAAALFEAALMARAMEGFASARELATTRLNRCLAHEAAAVSSLTLTNVGEAARLTEAYQALVSEDGLPLQQLRGLVWRAEISVEEAAPPAHILTLLERAEQLQQRYRIANGMHAMLMKRNKGEVLTRLGRLGEAEEAFQEAARIGGELSYTPVRIITSLARLYMYRERTEETRALGEACLRSTDVQKDLTRAFGQILVLLADVSGGKAPAGWFDDVVDGLKELRRLGVWPIAYRHLALYALAVAAAHAGVEQAERMLQLVERALEWSPSPTASALFRRYKGLLLMRRARYTEARQSLEAARATFDVSGNVPEAALVRRLLANLDALTGAVDAAAHLRETEAELVRLGLSVPPVLRAEAVRASEPPEASVREAPERLGIERLIVPLQRLGTRGVGAPILQKELLNIATELLPGRAVRLEEVASSGVATELGAREGSGAAALEWFEFSDGVGRRIRLGVGGSLDETQRAALQVLVLSAALAFEVAGLRGFSAVSRRSASEAGAEPDAARLPDVIAASPSMRRLKSELSRLSGSRATIIVTGESGTGKEVVARAIHDLSRRAAHPYVTFNSAAVPRELFEGQLFGYKKGAFTGATTDHPGVIRAAEGGTLFLDEIGELPLDIQPKLLRFLENSEVLPLGERKPVQVDVRVIAATHRDLLQLVREGKFREDLYYRLQVIPVNIAPLRERREDVVALARFFIRKLTPPGATPPLLTPEAELKLMSHPWPGNVRELRNVIERSLAFDPLPSLLGVEDLRL
jgi:tetratricopeptide (TPR) repeat protein